MTQEQLNQIADLIAKSLEDGVPEAVDAAVEARLKELNLSENADIKEIKTQLKELVEKAKFWSWTADNLHETKELFVEALKGLRKWDLSWIKAMNTATAADGGYLVHPEFEKGVFKIMGDYGIWKDCNVQRMKSDTKYFTKRVDGVQVFYTDQAAAYQSTAMSYDRVQMIAKKVGAILSSTYELIEDEADSDEIRWAAQQEFAEAFAKFLDTEVLLGTWDSDDNSEMIGITNLEDVNVVTLTGGISTLNHDALIDAIRKIDLKYKRNYKPKWYMSQDAIAVIEKLKDLDWRPLYRTLDNGEKGYLLGYPVELTDVMPSWAIDEDTPFIVFGSLKFYNIGIKRWFTFEMWYKSGDWEKDIKSLKASARVCGLCMVDEAFSIIKTAAEEPDPENGWNWGNEWDWDDDNGWSQWGGENNLWDGQ